MVAQEESAQRALLEIQAKLQELYDEFKRFTEHSNIKHLESILTEFKKTFYDALIHHISDDVTAGLEANMVDDCHMRKTCKSLLQAFLKDNARLILDEKLSEDTIADCRLKLGNMKSKAPYAQCSICFSEASKLLDQQIDLMRSLRIYVEKQEERLNLSKMPVEFVVSTLLEPLTNKQRLQILKALAGETKTFSVLSELTGIRGGNLLFHLNKLIKSGMILQRHDRGDYMITEKGYTVLREISKLFSLLEQDSSRSD